MSGFNCDLTSVFHERTGNRCNHVRISRKKPDGASGFRKALTRIGCGVRFESTTFGPAPISSGRDKKRQPDGLMTAVRQKSKRPESWIPALSITKWLRGSDLN